MQCRPNCGGCCIAPSISSALPNMPEGKAAGVFCANLDPISYQCSIWGQDNYPKVCQDFKAGDDVCGTHRNEALKLITIWEQKTCP